MIVLHVLAMIADVGTGSLALDASSLVCASQSPRIF